MADEREGQKDASRRDADDKTLTTGGRKDNAAQPLDAAKNEAGPERYPSVRQDDAVERTGEARSFDPKALGPAPRQGAGDTSAPVSPNDGRLGPAGDPAEGKR